jgi:hypothetical protein
MTDIVATDSGKFDAVQFDRHEVAELIDSIRSAATTDEDSVHGASVFDASAMSPLSAASAVSQPHINVPTLNTWNGDAD